MSFVLGTIFTLCLSTIIPVKKSKQKDAKIVKLDFFKKLLTHTLRNSLQYAYREEEITMMAVNEVSKLTGVSIRTLQYYDTIGLLKPIEYTESGYRLYDDTSLERLQQILLFKELEFPLKEIKKIIDAPNFDRNKALEQQIELLTMKKEHLENLISFARGIKGIGVKYMDFKVFDTRKIDEYSKRAKEQWGQTSEYKEFEEKTKNWTKDDEATVANEFMIDYINWGGFPLRFSFTKESDIKRYLEQTYEGILDKDIITDRSKVNRQNFERVATYIMANAGKEFSSKNIENYFIHQNADTLDKKTIYRYLDKMEKACLIDRVKRFNIVGKQAMSYIEKQYAVDTGFRMINTNLVNFEDTFFLENIIYNELKARDYEVFTGKTYKGEIDFVAINGRKKCFIQVAYYLAGKATIEREFGAFKPISDASPKYVFSLDRFDYSRDGIAHINIVDFLLGKKDINLS